MGSPELRREAISLAECVPSDVSFIDDYQTWARNMIVWDNPSHTMIKGQELKPYFLSGLKEELGELTGMDRTDPKYNRFGAIILSRNTVLTEVAADSIERHLKEFGDVSWYLANYLACFDTKFSSTVEAGLNRRQEERSNSPQGNVAVFDAIERQHPEKGLFVARRRIIEAAEAVVDVSPSEDSQPKAELIMSSGHLAITMMHLLIARFNTTFQTVLDGNRSKLIKRVQDGTIYDKTMGDDR